MYQGEMIEDGPREQVLGSPIQARTREFIFGSTRLVVQHRILNRQH